MSVRGGKIKGLFLDYSKWTSVRKAKDWLVKNNIDVEFRSLISNTPTKDEILSWVLKYKADINKFFNVNGKIFKENNLKEKINELSLEECADMLSKEGMLIKRPIYMGEDFILFGFKEKEWESYILKK